MNNSSRLFLLTVSLLCFWVFAACTRTIPREDTATPTTAVINPAVTVSIPTLPPAGGEPTIDPNTQIATPEPGVTESAPVPTVPTLPTVSPEETPVVNVPDGGVYVVAAGDTLGKIADQFGLTIDELAAANGLVDVNSLDIGQELVIPTAGTTPVIPPTAVSGGQGETIHIVQAGENLYRIGLQYGFTVEELAAYNGIIDPNSIQLGQEIRIPPSN